MRLRKDMAAHQENVAAHFPTFMSTMAEQQKINAQLQQQIAELQNAKASVSYDSLYNSCCCGKLDAWRQLKDMADGGDKIAKIYAILSFLKGNYTVPKNRVVAEGLAVALLPWLRSEAAEGNNLHAMYGLACCYYHGAGVAEDKVEAAKWYRLAADQGHAAAQFNVGCCYGNVVGVAEDEVEALKWYRVAADQGHAAAQFNVGCCYDSSKGVAEDKVEALKWYRLAADQGNADAQYNMGYAYEHGGDGVAVDIEEARKWYQLAADQGDDGAQSRLDTLGGE
jgi:TPR repeat protein